MKYETTNIHPQLKGDIQVLEATNPTGMHVSNAHWVMTKEGIIYYESEKLQEHINMNYITILA